jgi:hypothetical protein
MSLKVNNLSFLFLKGKTENNVSLKKNKESNNPLSKSDLLEINEERKILKPIGSKDKQQNFYFLYTLEKPFDKIAMRTPNKLAIIDDITKLRAKGYTVIIDNKTTTKDFKDALYDPKAVGIVSLGHGGDGALITIADKTSTEGYLTHWDIDRDKVSKNLKMVYFQACQAGLEEKNWEKAIGTDVIAWKKSVSNLEVISSNAKIGSSVVFPVIGAVFSIKSQLENKSLSDLINKRY